MYITKKSNGLDSKFRGLVCYYFVNILFVCSVTEAPTRPPVPLNPCLADPCGPFSQCRSQRGIAACACLRGYIGIPPNCRPECVLHSECPGNLACLGEKCRDPCPGACGPYAECEVINHNAVCRCQQGYEGDPFTGCRRITTREYSTVIYTVLLACSYS